MIKKADILVDEALREAENNSILGAPSGLVSGFIDIDRLTDGWQQSNLIVIASRPGMGKTSFIVSMTRNMAVDFNYSVLIFSLEMPSSRLINRMISLETGYSLNKINKGDLEPHEWELLNSKTKGLSKASLFFDDDIDFSIQGILKRAEKHILENDVNVIFIDYIQLISLGNKQRQNREEELSIIIKQLKLFARRFNIPIIITSQLSRNIETRGGSKRPLLNDIRDSGAIEDDADIVAFLYRPESYGMTEWDDDERTPCEGQAEFIVAKHRNGGLNNIRLEFSPLNFKFSNLEKQQDVQFSTTILNNENTLSADDVFGSPDDVPF